MHNVSVIIPTFNRVELVGRAITSALQQTLSPLEILVVDDGSTDGSADFINHHFPTVTLLQQQNAGVSNARNTGINASRGDWIALLDSDDEWLPGKLLGQQQTLAQSSDCRLVHSDELWIRNGVRVNPMNKHRKSGGWIYPQCLPLCAISPSAAVIRRDVFDDIGLFDESLPACEDYDFWLRFCAIEPVAFNQETLLRKYGGHDDQLSRQHWGMDRFRMQALAKVMESGKLSAAHYSLTRLQLQEKLRIYSLGAAKRGKTDDIDALARRYAHLVP